MAESLDDILQSLIIDHADFVAQGEFAWLLDIQMMGYTSSEMIVNCNKSSFNFRNVSCRESTHVMW